MTPEVEFRCPHCLRPVKIPSEIAYGEEFTDCPTCGKSIDLTEINLPTPPEYYYIAPRFECRHCGIPSELPASGLPESDEDGRFLLSDSRLPELPPEGWRATFGCLACGHVQELRPADVRLVPVPRATKGSHQSGKGVVLAEFPCADRHCKAPFAMYVDARGSTLSAIVPVLRRVHFHCTLPCGHPLMPVPEKCYRITFVTGSMW